MKLKHFIHTLARRFSRGARSLIAFIGISVAAAATVSPAQAQYAAAERPAVQKTTAEILEALLPELVDPKTRGITRDNAAPQVQLDAPKATLFVAFEEGTEMLTVEGMRMLRELSTALTDPRLADYHFQIAAHSYATADPQIEVRTTRRAQQIAEHLAAFYQIDIYRLQPIGVGARYVLAAQSPDDPINYRIEVFRIAG